MTGKWKRVICAADCEPCSDCGELVCPKCKVHYYECDCPGPTQDDDFEYRALGTVLYARPR